MNRNIKGKFIKGHKSFRKKNTSKCRVNKCNRLYLAQGYCNKHYQRWRTYGDPIEPYHRIGRPLSGTEFICKKCKKFFIRRPSEIKKGSFKFCSNQCSNKYKKGQLKEIIPLEKRKWYLDHKGYLITTLRGKRIFQHRWIVETKILKRLLRKEEIIHHLNGIKSDNKLENLSVCKNKTHYEFIKKLQERILHLEKSASA